LDRTRKPEPTPKPDDYVISLEGKLSAQTQQISEYKAEIERLYGQLRTEKEEKRSSAAEQFSQIGQLQKQISDW
jgi:chromosome segregation ATPase